MVNHITKTAQLKIDCTLGIIVSSTMKPNFSTLEFVKNHEEDPPKKPTCKQK